MMLFLPESTRHLKARFKRSGLGIGGVESYRFADEERGYRLKQEVTKKGVAVVASVLPNPESLFDLLALIRLLAENGAEKTTLIIPYLGYARQDRPSRKGEGTIGLMIVDLLKGMCVSKIILVDVHSPVIRQAFGPSVAEISALPLFAQALSKRPPEVIVAPDAGSIRRAGDLAGLITPAPEVATIEKIRPRRNVALAKALLGEVRGKKVLILDDMIDTGGTLQEAFRMVSIQGASSISLAATHGIFSKHALDRLLRLPIEQLWVTNTLPQIRRPKIRVLDIVPLLVSEMNRP